MTRDRIKQIQYGTAYPDSHSVRNALHQVWLETVSEYQSRTCSNCKWKLDEYCIKFDDFRAIAILDGQGCGKFERRSK